jgi:hypothetical protein
MMAHEEEMPRSPGEWLVRHLVDELGVAEDDAILCWVEFEDYCKRVARLLNEDADTVAVCFDEAFGMFVFMELEDE